MRHSRKIIIGLLATTSIAAASLVFLPRAEDLKHRFQNEATNLLHENVTVKSASLQFFPSPTLLINDISVGNGISAKQARLTIGFLGLFQKTLSGKNIHFSNVKMQNYTIDSDKLDRFNLLMRLDNSPLFGIVSFDNLETDIKFIDEKLSLTQMQGKLNWQNTHAPIHFQTTGLMDGNKADLDFLLQNPENFAKQRPATLSAKLNLRNIEQTISGQLTLNKSFDFAGNLKLNAPTLSAAAKITANSEQISLNNISLSSYMVKNQGELSYNISNRKLTGNLNFDKVTFNQEAVINRFSDQISNKSEKPQSQKKSFIETASIKVFIKQAEVNGFLLNDCDIDILKQNNQLKATLNQSIGYNGQFSGIMISENSNIKAHIKANKVSMLEFLPQFNLNGLANLDLTAQFQKNQPSPSLVTLKLNMGEGAFQQGNLDDTLKEVIRRPLARTASQLRSGNSPFQSLEGAFELKSGIISTTSNLNIATTHYNAEIQGKSPWNGRGLDYKGVAHLKAEKIDLPFMLKGNYNEPSLRFDVQQLIKQSRATLPLRSGARDEEAAKVVREIISRSPAPEPQINESMQIFLNLPKKP